MSPKPPTGLALFDSAAAMLQATARYLHGRDFAGLGQPRLYRALVRRSDLVPRQLRQTIFARAGAREGVAPGSIGEVDTDAIAAWATDLYPRRRYPAALVGASSGALVHLAAALGIPWLPQTFLTLLQQRADPDEPAEAMETALEPAREFLSANPGVALHHMHDPSQDRLMLHRIGYFRWKYRRLPAAYRDFLTNALEPGAPIIVADCGQTWPTSRLDERHVFQAGALGGPTRDEYFSGGPRVAEFLRTHGSHRRAWSPPPPDTESPEAEWGFDPELIADVEALGRPVLRLRFERPDDLSHAIAELHRERYRRLGCPAQRVVIESFILLDPYWTVRTGSVPFWMVFNMQPSLDRARRYLSEAGGFDEILLMLFAHGVDSIGLPSIGDWRDLLASARRRGAFLGVNETSYPAHFSAFARFDDGLRCITPRRDLPPPLALADVREQLQIAAGVSLEPL